MNYILKKIPNDWVKSRGLNSTVMVCDTGCDINHPSISANIELSKAFAQPVLSTNTRHGTHVTGIICGHSDKLNGVAIDSKIIIAQIMKGSSGNYEWLIEALQWAKTLDVDVLNLSFAYPNDDKKIFYLLKDLTDKGVLIISACADYPDIYPSSYQNIISISSYSSNSKINKSKIDLYAHDVFYSSIPMNQYGTISGNSMATAYCSGIAALAKGYDKSITKEKFLATIRDSQEPMNQSTKSCRVFT